MLTSLKPLISAATLALSLIGLASQCFSADAIPPSPPADTPVAAIVVTDATGLPVEGDIGFGQLMIVTSEKSVHGEGPFSLIWEVEGIGYDVVEKSMKKVPIQTSIQPVGWKDADGKDLPSRVTIVTPVSLPANILSIDIVIRENVALNNKLAFTKIRIKCGQGSQPPPGPGPAPTPDPTPQPLPKSKNIFVSIISDDANRSPEVSRMFQNLTSWESLTTAGVPWLRYDLGDKSGSPTFAASKTALSAAGVTVSSTVAGYVVIDRDTKAILYAGKLTGLDDVKKTVQAITGKAL